MANMGLEFYLFTVMVSNTSGCLLVEPGLQFKSSILARLNNHGQHRLANIDCNMPVSTIVLPSTPVYLLGTTSIAIWGKTSVGLKTMVNNGLGI